jgi:DNA modification methylase
MMTPNDRVMDCLLQGDSLTILPSLPKQSVDLIFADPPYNLQLQRDLWRPNLTHVDGVNDSWDQFEDFAAYDSFTEQWLSAAREVMKESASIWVSGTYHNIFRVGSIMQDLGFWILNTVTIFKPNAMPNFRGRRLKNDVEYVIWAQHSQNGRYTFNQHAMKGYNAGKQLGSVWTIPVCGGPERLRDAEGKKLHSTQKPEALLERILIASSKPGDLVLDPFSGSGTTAAVAKRLRRHWIAIERERAYVEAAQRRVDAVEPLNANHPLVAGVERQRRARLPFRKLLDYGYVRPGQILYLDRPDCQAVVQEDGKLVYGMTVGSIHGLAAQLKGVPSCNGWMHWSVLNTDTGESLLIDQLRRRLREEVSVA